MAMNFAGLGNQFLPNKIRQLCAEHGYKAVKEGIELVLREDFQALQEIFASEAGSAAGSAAGSTAGGAASVPKKVDHVQATPLTQTNQAVEQSEVEAKEKEKKTVKKAKKEQKESPPEFAEAAETFEEDMIDNLVDSSKLGSIKAGTEIVVSKLGSSEEAEVRPTFSTSAEEKAWQKEEETKTLAKLRATGITPESLLTKENLEQWIGKEKKGYAYVARRHVGLPEATIVATCKEYGIVSEAAKRRQAIIASRTNVMRGRGRGR